MNNTFQNCKPSFEELYELMVSKGIKFNITGKNDAIKTLKERNYYYKLTVYKRNFKRNNNDQFIDLEFSYLEDLARIDMELRYLCNQAALDIEHALKTFLITAVTENSKEDGYKIVASFFHSEATKENGLNKERLFEKNSHENSYQYKLYKKHKDSPSIWVLVEIMSFGDFLRLFDFYFKKYPSSQFQIHSLMGILMSIKRIRNASAHNTPFLFDLSDIKLKKASRYLEDYAKKLKIGPQFYLCPKVHDILALFWAHQFFIKGARTLKNRYTAFNKLTSITNETFSYLSKENDIIYFFNVIKKAIDSYNKE